MKKTFFILIYLYANILFGQKEMHTNLWSRVSVTQPINSKLKAEVEFQKRWQNDGSVNSNTTFDTKLMSSSRFWTHYQFNDKLIFLISPFAYYENEPIINKESDKIKKNSYENRYAGAMQNDLKLTDKLKLQSKTGIEYRDFKNTAPDYFRFREKVSLKYNFNTKIALVGYDEILINATNSNGLHHFDQNRLGLSFIYNPIKVLKLELGFMKIERSQKTVSDLLDENDLVVNCYYTLPNKKINKENSHINSGVLPVLSN